jgi:hypothetical protein
MGRTARPTVRPAVGDGLRPIMNQRRTAFTLIEVFAIRVQDKKVTDF